MQIELKGRNVAPPEELRSHLERRLRKVARQVSDLARLEVEVHEQRNRRVADRYVVDAVLYLKGVTLRASDASADLTHAVNLVVDELARQVKRRREKVRRRRERALTVSSLEPAPIETPRPSRGVLLAF
ncbi:MAG TPA: ribosome-associated translation inhibitor RaiA [Solirubrobacteraceae bacterium]|nr:ribosome-associated translation inhibitor RaiA [Solirubrobacteraceae bacterium]